ncbi:hypothetical protein TBLA_0C06030 [Henningerozyma blattae CBS 6284]|uniref:Elongation of fatty acids protein n=1 Tax=Henningerozyma blattae (strain ATCC 34711 / CBS 6284 / DSM 70876 / NBRC 10599 / NRRL Y-10934 / UCD 77-7) TaxID=1071380 RepID=I2H1Z8_HENB6|nr:hypothetical protein TBLA_0C06030 [Tetrapisispora blattae CBS 6284]CCH60400.1 hypothetical protein TBLA_0C06030 [Tetrapisispora blattae CBS 6284]
MATDIVTNLVASTTDDTRLGHSTKISSTIDSFNSIGQNRFVWYHFNSWVSKITNSHFVPNNFDFNNEQLPLTSLSHVVTIISLYYILIFGGQFLLCKFQIKPFKFDRLSKLHNLALSATSFILLILMVEQILPIIKSNGIYFSICNKNSWNQPIVTLYYLNYIVKFIEFIDTFLLVLKQKKLTFLHTYHHGATALLCYTQLVGKTSVSWVPISLNLAIHVLMYWYYFLSSCNIKVWWKQWVTKLQIVQFIIDIGFVYFVAYERIAFKYFANTLPYCGECTGTDFAIGQGCLILSSYLVLFISFYKKIYKRKAAALRKTSTTKKLV